MQDIFLQPSFAYGFLGGVFALLLSKLLPFALTFRRKGPDVTVPASYNVIELNQKYSELKNQIAWMTAPSRPEAEVQTYQQAADWLRMVNSITWTIGSIYLVAAFTALNGALSERLVDTVWRQIIGGAVAGLSVIWFFVDNVYSASAKNARTKLTSIEHDWRVTGANFFTQQEQELNSRTRMANFLRISMLLPLLLGLFVACEPLVRPVLLKIFGWSLFSK